MDPGHRTEAACLLETGATYRQRIGLQSSSAMEAPIFAGFKAGAFSLYYGDAPIYHFDLEGRWQRAFVDGIHFLKGLDARTQAIDRVRDGTSLVLKRRALEDDEAGEFDERIRSMALDLIAGIDAGQFDRLDPPAVKAQPVEADKLRGFLESIVRWDRARWRDHRACYQSAYGSLPFLPPECQSAVVLKATQGRVGRFGTGCPPSVKPWARSVTEFERHASAVAALWGGRLVQSKVIMLADSDVLNQPAQDVIGYLEAANRVFAIETKHQRIARDERPVVIEPNHRFESIHAFVDQFAPSGPPRTAWADFAARGLSRVSLLIESGDSAVRALYLKNWRDDDLRTTLGDLKSAGLGASVLTLVGAGGIERAGSHIAQTSQLIASLDLGPGDFVFLLDENELCEPEQRPQGLIALGEPAWSESQARLKDALAPLKKRGVKVLPYTLEKQGA
jgi:hypothetical protein